VITAANHPKLDGWAGIAGGFLCRDLAWFEHVGSTSHHGHGTGHGASLEEIATVQIDLFSLILHRNYLLSVTWIKNPVQTLRGPDRGVIELEPNVAQKS